MPTTSDIVLYHAPNTRSSGTLLLLEELGAPYQLHVLNMKTGEQRRPEFLAINPMGKLPAIRHNGALITEQAAVSIYLADLFPDAGLTPAISDPRRGPYLRWFAFYGGCFEPAIVDKYLQRDPGPQAMSPYGTYDAVIETLCAQLRAAPYLTGEQPTAVDVLWGSGLGWTTMFKLVPERPEIMAYVKRMKERPAAVRAREKDAALVSAGG